MSRSRARSALDVQALRREAEERLGPPGVSQVPEQVEVTRLVHELRVHQLELETQNRALEEARLEAEVGWDQYRALYDFAPAGYFTLDRQGRILQTNLEGARLLGTDRLALKEQRFAFFIGVREREGFAAFLAAALQGPHQEPCEFTLLHHGQRGPRVRLHGATCGSGDVLQLVAVDISTLDAARQEVRALNEGLERRVAERTAELQQANADQQAFSYMISHELRAPLARLEGFSRMLRQGGLTDPARLEHIAERIEASSQNMRAVVDTLLVLSRLCSETVEPERLDLSAMARDLMAALAKEGLPAPARVSIAEGLTATGDRRLLELCLHNLLENAVKFSARTPEPRVAFGATRRQGQYCLFVKDNGAGFDPAHAGKLFQAFVRLHRQEDFPGTGLGLNIARKIIEKHGGRIWAEALPEAGATFYFTLGEA